MRKLNQKGSLLIFLTLGFALLATFIGFAVDFGRAYLSKARISRLVDGASLAAAKVLKGQAGYENQATRAACDSMAMNGAPVVMSGPGTCVATSGSPFTATINFLDVPVGGGPPIKHVQVTGNEPTPTTFLRFLGFMVPGNFSTINVSATAQAAPERPVDLMLVLDRSGSMGPPNGIDGTGRYKIDSLKIAVNAFLGLENTFSADDRIGMVSFSTRGCGNATGGDSIVDGPCTPDVPLDFFTDSQRTTLQNRVSGLNASGGTNTMEALRTARPPLAQAFDDPSRATTRKAVLLVTDGQPTFLRRDNDGDCKKDPRDNSTLPNYGDTNAGGGPFTNGCKQGVPSWKIGGNTTHFMFRQPLGSGNNACLTRIPGSHSASSCPPPPPPVQSGPDTASLYHNALRCSRSLTSCVTKGAMYEANVIRNCGFGNSSCSSAGEHDIIIFIIAIGRPEPNDPQNSVDQNARCLLGRIANATDIVNAATGVVETMTANCNAKFKTIDDDTHDDLVEGCSGPCTINSTQQKGKVFTVDVNGDVTAQLQSVFNEIAALLKLRLVI